MTPQQAQEGLAAIEFDPANGTLYALRFLPARAMLMSTPLALSDWRSQALEFPESRITKLDFHDRWPGFTVHIRGFGGQPESYRFKLPERVAFVKPSKPWADFAAKVDPIVAVARERGWPMNEGWLAHPVVDFEPMKMPAREDAAAVDAGAYRAAAVQQRVIWREAPGSLERLWGWVTSLSGSWVVPPAPRAVALTDEAVIADFGDEVLGVPRHTLRAVHRFGDDAVYLFGRYAGLTLFGRSAPCPVREALDAQYASRREIETPT